MGEVSNVVGLGIEPQHFADDECRGIWEFMVDHAVKFRSAPSFEVVVDRFPEHNFEVTTDSTEYLVDRFVKNVKRRLAIDAVRDIAAAIDEDLLDRARQLSTVVPAKRVMCFKDVRERIAAYDQRMLDGNTRGLPFGIPTIDNATLGMGPGELTTVVGWQGTGKSTLMQYIFFNAWVGGTAELGLFFSLE